MSVGRQVTAGRDKTLTAAADLSASTKRYTFVKASAAQSVDTAGAGEMPIGIQQNKPESGDGCVVRLCGCGGSSILRIGETVTAGDPLKVGANGLAMKATPGDQYFAIANEGATFVATEEIEALLQTGIM
jgi:hypothetical protein